MYLFFRYYSFSNLTSEFDTPNDFIFKIANISHFVLMAVIEKKLNLLNMMSQRQQPITWELFQPHPFDPKLIWDQIKQSSLNSPSIYSIRYSFWFVGIAAF